MYLLHFINLNNMPNDILYKIKMFVDFTRENAKELQKTEDILNEEKNTHPYANVGRFRCFANI